MEWRRHIARYGDDWFPGEPWVRWTFLVLFAVAAVLRFWNLPGQPFTHDELSALMRIYPSLGETIQRGVIELDTHPPGVQVFEWAWTKVFGTSEAAVKLPFILLALLALFHLYRFALVWTSVGTALISTALLASLQYTVLYAQIARPYAIGFFTIALLADRLTRYLAFNERKDLIWIGVATVLSAYTHHFSLLLAGIMVVSVFPLLAHEQRKPYLLLCLSAALLYTPNLTIFTKQFALGGLGNWLPPPDAAWLPDYLRWILHFSPVLYVVVGAGFLVGIALAIKQHRASTPALWLLPVWGLSPLVIGFAYSVWRSPVLQYSLVLFSFPFVVQWLFMGFRLAPRWLVLTTTGSFTIAATITLITDRKHPVIFTDSPYAAMVRVAQNEIIRASPERTLVIFDAPRPQVEFHVVRYGLDQVTSINWARQQEQNELLQQLGDPQWTRVVLGTTNGCLEERVAQVRSQFPYLVHLEEHVEGQVHVFSRKPVPTDFSDRVLLMTVSPAHRAGHVDIAPHLNMWHDSLTRTSAWDMEGHDYGISASFTLEEGSFHPDDLFEADMLASHHDGNPDVVLVFELRNASDSILIYRAERALTIGNGSMAFSAFAPSWVRTPIDGPLHVSMYVHNPSRKAVRIHALHLYHREHNPVRNALLKPILDLGRLPRK